MFALGLRHQHSNMLLQHAALLQHVRGPQSAFAVK
jgi:hypothetical protein